MMTLLSAALLSVCLASAAQEAPGKGNPPPGPPGPPPPHMGMKSPHDRFMEKLTDEERNAIRRLDGGKPLAADFNDPALAKFLLDYDRQFNPDKR